MVLQSQNSASIHPKTSFGKDPKTGRLNVFGGGTLGSRWSGKSSFARCSSPGDVCLSRRGAKMAQQPQGGLRVASRGVLPLRCAAKNFPARSYRPCIGGDSATLLFRDATARLTLAFRDARKGFLHADRS